MIFAVLPILYLIAVQQINYFGISFDSSDKGRIKKEMKYEEDIYIFYDSGAGSGAGGL